VKKPCPECEKIRESVSALFDGELAKAKAEALAKRIHKCAEEGCGECLRLLNDLKKMDRALKSFTADCSPPDVIVDDLRKRVRKILKSSHGVA